MFSELDHQLMRRALLLAHCGHPAPNPRVGCVIERDGVILGEGYHNFAGGLHAEVEALLQAEDVKGATVYVTLEPCNHFGRQPPCSEALIERGVSRVVFAMKDPNPEAKGGAARLMSAGIQADGGLLADEVRKMNRVFLTRYTHGRPYVMAKIARSLDGFSGRHGESVWITSEESRRIGWWLRAEAGAVLVGANTVEQDDPLLTARLDTVINQPLRVVLDPSGRCDRSRRVFGSEAETVHIVGTGRGSEGTVQLSVGSDQRFRIEDIFEVLVDLRCAGVLVEGGSTTLESFLEAGAVDELHVHIGRVELGSGIPWLPHHLVKQLPKPVEIRAVGEDRHEKYLLTQAP